MNIKDRLQKNIITNNSAEQKKSQPDDFIISDIFNDTQQVKDLLVELISNKKNIILISKKSFDKIIIANYISQLLQDKNTFIIDDIDNNGDCLNDRFNIILNPNIHIIVKILEQILYGCQSFIFGLNLGSYDNIIDKLKVLIAINYKNLSSKDINTLLAASNLNIVYISKNDKGQLYISKIDEMKFNNVKCELEIFNIYNTGLDVIEEQSNEIVENILDDVPQIVEENQEIEDIPDIIEPSNTIQETEKIEEEEIIPVENNVIETSSIPEQTEPIEQAELSEPSVASEEPEPVEQFEQAEPIENIEQEQEPVNKEEEIQPVISSSETVNTEPPITETRVLNKYQLLKEKAKRKRLEENLN